MILARLAVASLAVSLAACTASIPAAQRPATRPVTDSALVGRVLLAEDRRDSAAVALEEAMRSGDGRVRMLAARARARIRDPRYSARDSAPASTAPAPPTWPEPAWRLRYRALTAARNDCAALRTAMADSAWAVRLRAADLATVSCSADDAIATTLRDWVDALPADASTRAADGVSWHAAAHAVVALARLRPGDARPRVRTMAAHGQWQARMYAARAAAILADSATLRALARDAHDNVREAAIDGLARLTSTDTALFLSALQATGPQVVRAAAIALAKLPSPAVTRASMTAFDRWVARANASERDVRVALLAAAGRPATDDRPPAPRYDLSPRAIALALGDDVRLRVRMTASSGGGTFTVRLRGDAAPMMAARILALARAGYYNGLTWHRVEPDFVIQGGSPGASEYVGLPHFLRDELGTVPHRRGTVGMSTRGHDTGDAQWFVNLRDNLRLNADYTVFAEVIDGIDVVDGVLEGDVIERIEEVPR